MSTGYAHPVTPRLRVATDHQVAVVADHAAGHRMLRALLADAGVDPTTLRSLDAVGGERPDAVVLLADASALRGLAALRRVRKKVPGVPVVVVAPHDAGRVSAREALNAGADGYVSVVAAERSLAAALDAVVVGFLCVPREVRRLVAKPTFSHREKEVLELLVTGLTNAQIAARLHLAESTVKSHIASAFAKLGVRSRKDAATLLLDPAEGLAPIALPPRLA